MGRIVIAAYRPHPGKEAALLQEVKEHLPTLRRCALVTDRPAVVMRAADGTLVEVFEWTSREAIEKAHEEPLVQEMWARFASCCDYITLASLAESKELFAELAPVEL